MLLIVLVDVQSGFNSGDWLVEEYNRIVAEVIKKRNADLYEATT